MGLIISDFYCLNQVLHEQYINCWGSCDMFLVVIASWTYQDLQYLSAVKEALHRLKACHVINLAHNYKGKC